MDHEQVKDVILYDKHLPKRPKKKLEKDDYVDLQENTRVMHNYVLPTNNRVVATPQIVSSDMM